jgi:hypothetical protein
VAENFAVLSRRERLPDAPTLEAALKKAKLPLRLPEAWSWGADSGWWPMAWRGTESGCEVELEAISRKEKTAAAKAGFPGLDCVVVITVRGWDSLQSGACLCAVLAVESGGCVSPSDGEYMPASAALRWARGVVKEADAALSREAQALVAREAIERSGGAEKSLAAGLAGLEGVSASSLQFMMDRLCLVVDGSARILSAVWQLRSPDGTVLTHGRYAELRDQQMALLRAENPPVDLKAQLTLLEDALDAAGEADEAVLVRAPTIVSTWTGQKVVDCRRDGDRIRVSLENGAQLEFLGRGFSGVSIRLGGVGYSLTNEGVSLS